MRTLKATIEYEGTAYHGWQRQENALTIQEVIEDVLKKITGQKILVICSGRTDAGVHAFAQVGHFKTDSELEDWRFQKGMNALLPPDIVISHLKTMENGFHARYSAKSKRYRYIILNRQSPSAFDFRYAWQRSDPLNLENMIKAGQFLKGKHDFTSFRSSTCGARNPVREIISLDIYRENEKIIFLFEGNGFLKQMIRNIVGTVVEVGRGRMDADSVHEILVALDRRKAGPAAPPQGLCLLEVIY